MVFNTVDALPISRIAFTRADRQVAEAMHTYWVNFGTSANPNSDGLPKWPRYSAASDELLLIGNEKMEVKARFRQVQLDVLIKVITNRSRGD